MSVILYEDEKFMAIRATMKQDSRDWACTFGYPDNWNDWPVMEETIDEFCQWLRLGNIRAWNERYEGKEPDKILPQRDGVSSYRNNYELLQALHSVSYNCIEAEDTELEKILDKVIAHLSYKMLAAQPEWKAADTW